MLEHFRFRCNLTLKLKTLWSFGNTSQHDWNFAQSAPDDKKMIQVSQAYNFSFHVKTKNYSLARIKKVQGLERIFKVFTNPTKFPP